MIYSVWNQADRLFDYYETSARNGVANAPAPKHLRSTKLGMTPAEASWPLPAGARSVGRGPVARGQIASRSGGVLSGFDDTGTVKIGLLLLAAFLLWKKAR